MRIAVAAIALLVGMADAQAISRYTSTSMSCARIHATLRAEGAAILRYRSVRNPSLPLYGRYVSDRRFCKMDEYTEQVSIPAADTRSCPVRECRLIDVDDSPLIWRPRF